MFLICFITFKNLNSGQIQNIEHSVRLFKKVSDIKNEQKKSVDCSRLKEVKVTQTNAMHEASLDTRLKKKDTRLKKKRLYNKTFGGQLGK